MADISVTDNEWKAIELNVPTSFRPRITLNRGFAKNVLSGSMVVIPRPGNGICYIGRIAGKFELVDDPPWADDYLELRRQSGLDASNVRSHIGDVVQSWAVEDFRVVPFPVMPGWIKYLLLSRSTIGWLSNRPDGRAEARNVLQQLYEGEYTPDFSPTRSIGAIEGRLLDWTTPSSFEHLVCSLLQCEYPDEHWIQTGGSGDGGADGLSIDQNGRILVALQCKWKIGGDPRAVGESLATQLRQNWGGTPRIYVASLFHRPIKQNVQSKVTFLDRTSIARLLHRHRNQCPFAATLGIV